MPPLRPYEHITDVKRRRYSAQAERLDRYPAIFGGYPGCATIGPQRALRGSADVGDHEGTRELCLSVPAERAHSAWEAR